MSEQIRNCEFRFKCPKDWWELQPTKISTERFCTQCQKTVHFCRNQTELHDAIVKDLCVAIEIEPEGGLPSHFILGRPEARP